MSSPFRRLTSQGSNPKGERRWCVRCAGASLTRSGARAYAARAGGGGASRCRSTVTVGPDRRRPPRAARRVFGVQFARRATAVIPSRSSSTARRSDSASVRVARIVHVASPRVPLRSTSAEGFHREIDAWHARLDIRQSVPRWRKWQRSLPAWGCWRRWDAQRSTCKRLHCSRLRTPALPYLSRVL